MGVGAGAGGAVAAGVATGVATGVEAGVSCGPGAGAGVATGPKVGPPSGGVSLVACGMTVGVAEGGGAVGVAGTFPLTRKMSTSSTAPLPLCSRLRVSRREASISFSLSGARRMPRGSAE
ncbi:MAG: hypothetical protein E6J43_12085 [Chloroflexi bacterium]|nr:MAG: hypothetical protein E6J43_12085 [Chloroflexota bacterium]